ncbi:MAG: hypothetical protein U0992_22285 [Planctomycetaceae bacterium]
MQAFAGYFRISAALLLSGFWSYRRVSRAYGRLPWPDAFAYAPNDCVITDASEAPRLRHLYDIALDRTQITDRQLVDLAQLRNSKT